MPFLWLFFLVLLFSPILVCLFLIYLYVFCFILLQPLDDYLFSNETESVDSDGGGSIEELGGVG